MVLLQNSVFLTTCHRQVVQKMCPRLFPRMFMAKLLMFALLMVYLEKRRNEGKIQYLTENDDQGWKRQATAGKPIPFEEAQQEYQRRKQQASAKKPITVLPPTKDNKRKKRQASTAHHEPLTNVTSTTFKRVNVSGSQLTINEMLTNLK